MTSGTDNNFFFGLTNTATGNFSGAWGGDQNTAFGDYSTILGGQLNSTEGLFAAVVGGNNNAAVDSLSTVFGGTFNNALNASSILGGTGNLTGTFGGANGYNVVAGGNTNSTDDTTSYCAIVTGSGNSISASTYIGMVAAQDSSATSSLNSTILGGTGNSLGVAFGKTEGADSSVILGGVNNEILSTTGSVVMGAFASGDVDFAFVQSAGDTDVSSIPGAMQTYRLPINAVTTNNTQTTVFQLPIPSNSSISFFLRITARRTDANSEVALYEIKGIISNENGTTALPTTIANTAFYATDIAWVVDAQANNGTSTLDVKVTGQTGKTVQWLVAAEFYKICSTGS